MAAGPGRGLHARDRGPRGKSLRAARQPARRTATIFDLDGTLSSSAWRDPFVHDPDHRADWGAYFDHLVHDAPIPSTLARLHAARDGGHAVVLLTSRRERPRDASQFWVLANGIPYDELVMRRDDDTRRDVEVKRDAYQQRIRTRYDVVAAYDDRAHILEMWQEVGVVAHAVVDPDLDPAVARRVARDWHTRADRPGPDLHP